MANILRRDNICPPEYIWGDLLYIADSVMYDQYQSLYSFSGRADVPFRIVIRFCSLLAFVFLAVSLATAQPRVQADFSAEDFQARHRKIYAAIGDNLAIIQGAGDPQGSIAFRQSNTFYYLSGLVIPNAYLLLDGQRRKTTLYLTHSDPIQESNGGPKLSFEGRELVMKMTGVDDVRLLEKLAEDLNSYMWDTPIPALYTPHGPAEGYMQSRDYVLKGFARNLADPWDGRPLKVGHFIQLLKQRYPQFDIRDLTSTLDAMRNIKDEKEIALIRKASQLAGLGIMEAIRSTKPGVKEYQLEAAARFVFNNNGARGPGYSAIVGGGENAFFGHYSANGDSLKDGDLVLMDTAPDYRYYTSDVTRMWPVNGTYSKDQRDLYGFVIEYHKAFMRHIRPGTTSDQVLAAAAADMRKVLDEMTFSKEIYRKACEEALAFDGHFQHPVGMSVHDVGTQKHIPLEVGMVFSIDPMIWVGEERLYIRMEDVVVVTQDGVENLSANLPVEMGELEALWREKGIV
ncbi:MAG: M24 family metallopeptidase, partial [Gammaproteobacteria bacterium]|nr:M24 family metallopeptidase [Gammaproteobacteria bacterium]